MKRQRGLQKYRANWEKILDFKGWLSPDQKSCYKALCKVCDKILMADISVLRNHSKARHHLTNMERTVCKDPSIENNSKLISENYNEDSSNELRMKSLSSKGLNTVCYSYYFYYYYSIL